jgi:hypothetical protein
MGFLLFKKSNYTAISGLKIISIGREWIFYVLKSWDTDKLVLSRNFETYMLFK